MPAKGEPLEYPMRSDPLTMSLETVIAASPMLGHLLEDRSGIRNRQEPELVDLFREAGTIELSNSEQQHLFLVAPLDLLVVEVDGRKQFHITETNGTGIGGLTNLPLDVVATVLDGLTEMAMRLPEPNALVLVAISGMESNKNPRHNHLVHEKMLYAEALKRGFEKRGHQAKVLTMAQLENDPKAIYTDQPTIVLGYIKELLNSLGMNRDGRLHLFGRPVDGAVNDRFCLNVLSRFGHQVDMTRFATMNRCFVAGADKGKAYELLNEFAAQNKNDHFPARIKFSRASNRPALIAAVLNWMREGRKAVIKAQGTGLGHGIEFFLDPEEAVDSIIEKIDHSIKVTEAYYGAIGGAFPYTICEFIDTCTVPRNGHPLFGHKYEIRVIVYRDGTTLRALPGITKISSQGYDADKSDRLSLINNITTSAEAKKRQGTDFMLPLCNAETLEILGITNEQMKEICAFCSSFVRYILDQVQATPERFGLVGVWGDLFGDDRAILLKLA
jgi:hypothetical protein